MLSHKAFRIAIEHDATFDSIVWEAVADDGYGKTWVLNYDSYGVSPTLTVSLCHEVLFVPFPPLELKPLRTRDEIKCRAAANEP